VVHSLLTEATRLDVTVVIENGERVSVLEYPPPFVSGVRGDEDMRRLISSRGLRRGLTGPVLIIFRENHTVVGHVAHPPSD
jgi:hypothetical protein